jgi:hypothetical protein
VLTPVWNLTMKVELVTWYKVNAKNVINKNFNKIIYKILENYGIIKKAL